MALEKFSALDSISLFELLMKREIPMPNAASVIQIFSKILVFIWSTPFIKTLYKKSVTAAMITLTINQIVTFFKLI